MIENSFEEIAKELRKKIEYHNNKYYNEDSPEISDFEYDLLLRELENLEFEHPELVTENSPTQKVGGTAGPSFNPVVHEVPMESLHDSFSEEEICDFDKRIRLTVESPEYVVEPKIDGLSVSIEYVNGILFRASTRGDGLTGEDITENLRTIKSLPKKIKKAPEFLEVRGEVYMSTQNFMELVEQQELREEKPFKNPRNAAAGSLRQKNSEVTASRNLDIFIFNVQRITGKTLKTHRESLDYLKNLGLPVTPSYPCFNNIEDVLSEIRRIGEERGNLSFQTDGAVVKVNSFEEREKIGRTSKFPKWAEAFKYPPEQKETKLLGIEVNVGRTGVLTPTAVLEPVFLAGTTVGRATLHNQDFINEKKICVGDVVTVRKAGEIIPEVIGVKKHETGNVLFEMPKFCPSCGSPVVREDDEAAIRCENTECPAQLLRHLIHFVSRDAMDIDGLGPSLLERLVAEKMILSPADIYLLDVDKIQNMERMGKKSAENLSYAIEKSKTAGLSRLLFALGIRHVGKAASKLLAKNFVSIDEILKVDSLETFSEIDGFGDVMAQSVLSYFSLEKTRNLINKLREQNIVMTEKIKQTSDLLSGKTFVLTGTLPHYTRDQMKTIIEDHCGKVSGSVSKRTSFLLAGEDGGSKLLKAQSLGIKIISENEFFAMFSI